MTFLESIGYLTCLVIVVFLFIFYLQNKENNEEKIKYVKRNYKIKDELINEIKDTDKVYLNAYDKIIKYELKKEEEEQEYLKFKKDFALQHADLIFRTFKNNRVLTYEEIHDSICKEFNYEKYEYDPEDYDENQFGDDGDYLINCLIEYKILKQCSNKKYFTIADLLLKKWNSNLDIPLNWETYLTERNLTLKDFPEDY